MARPLALVGFSAYAALAWAAAWGPESARPLAVLCLLLALVCGGAFLGLRVRGQNRKKKRQQELPAEQPGALRAFCGAFLTLLAGGAVLLSYSAAWEKAVLPQSLDGRELQVRAQVRERIDILGKGGGYVFNTIHNIVAGVPAENLLAMYDEAKK